MLSLGLIDGLILALTDTDSDGETLRETLGLTEALGEILALTDGEIEALTDGEADGVPSTSSLRTTAIARASSADCTHQAQAVIVSVTKSSFVFIAAHLSVKSYSKTSDHPVMGPKSSTLSLPVR